MFCWRGCVVDVYKRVLYMKRLYEFQLCFPRLKSNISRCYTYKKQPRTPIKVVETEMVLGVEQERRISLRM